MKKNTSPASEWELKNAEKKSPDQLKKAHEGEDYSIASDKDPVIKKKESDKQYDQQPEFIDRDNNSKEQE